MHESSTSSQVISSDKVVGTSVHNTAGDRLGSIEELLIDKPSGIVRYAVLEFGGFLGIGTDRFPLPWSLLKYDTVRDGYVVPLDKNTLERAPRYPEDDAPAYTEDYGRKVHDYYGTHWP
jgi:hypothetical protein